MQEIKHESLLEGCGEGIDNLAQLGGDTGQGHLLEGSIGVPFLADGRAEGLLVLGPGCEGVGQLGDRIGGGLLVALLVDDNMSQLGILAFTGLYTLAWLRLLHYHILLLLLSLASPRALRRREKKKSPMGMLVINR